MPVTRQCTKCDSKVHIRKLVCQCGNVFRRSKPLTATLEARKHYAGSKGSTESEEQAIKRRRQNRNCAAKNRTLETAEHADARRTQVFQCSLSLYLERLVILKKWVRLDHFLFPVWVRLWIAIMSCTPRLPKGETDLALAPQHACAATKQLNN